MNQDELLRDLKKRVADGQVVAIIGSGVSRQVSGDATCASWQGLLRHGAKRCEADDVVPLIDSGELNRMLAAAETVSEKLGAPDGGEYRLWLRESVGSLPIADAGLLDAIHHLDATITTTNYDDLLTRNRSLQPVPWTNGSAVEEVIRGDRPGVIHLHGYYEEPPSVVLGIRSYDQVVHSKHAQEILRALRTMKTLLFIGCGDGLADPNLGALLAWSAEVFKGSTYRHFRLCRESELETLRSAHPPEQRLFPLSYGASFTDLESFLRSLGTAMTTLRPERGKLLHANLPALPTPMVARPEVVDRFNLLWQSGQTRVGLFGMGGCGKTVLASILAQDRRVTHPFPDGVLWLTVSHRDPLELLGELAGYLADSPPPLNDVMSARAAVRRLATDRGFLLVLDDLWTDDQAFALDVVGHDAALLATSRKSDVLQRLGVEPLDVALLSDENAALLLRASRGERGPSAEVAAAIARECGNLPLALAMAGALARRPGRTWEDALRLLREAKLEKFEPRWREYEHRTLLAAIEVGIRDLAEDDQHRYVDLAVFGNEWVPPATLRTFWGDDDATATFVERSLAILDDRNRLRLHDLQADYVRIRAGDAAPIHRRLVDAFRCLVAGGDFANATPALDDGYFFQRLPRHLVSAGLADELRRLMFDFRWLSAKLAATDANALTDDTKLLHEDAAAQLLRKTLRLAAPTLSVDRDQLAGQLLSRLPKSGPDIGLLLEGAHAWGAGRTWLRPMRPGLNPPGGCLQQRFSCSSAVRRLVYRGDNILDAFCGDGTMVRCDIELGTIGPLQEEDSAGEPRNEEHSDAPLPQGVMLPDEDKRRYGYSWTWLDRQRIVFGLKANNGLLQVVNVETGAKELELVGSLSGTRHEITVVRALDDRYVVTGSVQDRVGLWDLSEGRFVHGLKAHTELVTAIERIDERHFASGDADGGICVWDVSQSALETESARHSNRIMALAATPRGVVSSSYDDLVLLWDLEGKTRPRVLQEDAGWADRPLAVNERRVADVSDSGKLRVWDLEQATLVYEVEYGGRVLAMTKLDDERFVIGAGKEVHVWSVSHARLLRRWRAHRDTIRQMAVFGDRVVVTASLDETMRAWDLSTGREIASIEDEAGLDLVAVDRYAVFVTSLKGRLRAWDWERNECFDLANGRFEPFRLRPRGPFVCALTAGGGLAVFDLRARATVATIAPDVHHFKEDLTAWLDDRRVVTGSEDGGVRIWNLATGACETTSFMEAAVTTLQVVPTSSVIAAGDDAGNVQIFAYAPAVTATTRAGSDDRRQLLG